LRLILVGPPGSGKGTQAELLSERLGLAPIGTGDILREAIARATPAGRQAAPFVTSGRLVPDDLVNELVADRFRREDRPECFLLDGYPRTLAQAHSFDQVLRQQFLDLTDVVVLRVADDEIVRRLSGRWTCPNPACKATYHVTNKPPRVAGVCDLCGTRLVPRADDREETIRERLRIYHHNTEELIPHYRTQGLVREVPGEGPIEQIYSQILQVLNHQAGPPC
jgi:adenylate kinase